MTNGGLSEAIRVALVLPGLGRVQRGAETAFLEIGRGLSAFPDVEVTFFGSGPEAPSGIPIHQAWLRPRERFERWPKGPCFRDETAFEELTFVASLWRRGLFRAEDFDAVLTCTFPWVHWFVRWQKRRNPRLKHLFVTENGDWMCHANQREYKYFACDGLACINPEYYERNRARHRCQLIPNGVDPTIFRPRFDGSPGGTDARIGGIAQGRPVVLMVSALIESKRVAEGVQAVAQTPDGVLVVAGDGPEREKVAALAKAHLPGRHLLLGSIPRTTVPELFRQADAFLHMSQEEPFGIVYLEAAASGLPIVTHDGPTPRWILGDCARYAHSSDVAAIGRELTLVLRTELGGELGRRARERVLADWTWSALTAKYRSFLYDLVRPARAESLAAQDAS